MADLQHDAEFMLRMLASACPTCRAKVGQHCKEPLAGGRFHLQRLWVTWRKENRRHGR